MKLINRSNPNGDTNESMIGDNGLNETKHQNGNSLDGENDNDDPIASHTQDENRPSSLLFDFSNNSDMLFSENAVRKKRKPNPDKEKYLQEPQYVTKRSSSGRLVKMKIINDFDYTSDQDNQGKRKKSKLKFQLLTNCINTAKKNPLKIA